MMISNVKGEFQKFTGEVVFDPKRPEATELTASIDVASINTREEKRDAHLRSADFFDVEKFPVMTFSSRQATRKGDDLEVTGDLTIHGTTRSVVLTVSDVTAEHVDPWGNVRIGASAKAKVRRSEFGMQWNAALEAGGVLVGDEITITLGGLARPREVIRSLCPPHMRLPDEHGRGPAGRGRELGEGRGWPSDGGSSGR